MIIDDYSRTLGIGYFSPYMIKQGLDFGRDVARMERLRRRAEEEKKKVEATEGLRKKVIEDDEKGRRLDFLA
jgi:hypothetical protein